MDEKQKIVTTEVQFEKDELRARFTVWLDVTVYRAKLKYLRKTEQNKEVVSIDELPEHMLDWRETGFEKSLSSRKDFEFEEERLATAFAELPLMRKEILRLLFVEELEPGEIAAHLNCSVQHVYNQRSLAIKKLRGKLVEGGDDK